MGVLNQEITLMRELVVGAILIKGYRLTYKMSRLWEPVCSTGAVISTCCCLVIQSCLTLCDLMDCSLPGSSVHGFPRQGSWSGLPFPSPGHFHNPGIKPQSPAWQSDSLPVSHLGSPTSGIKETDKGVTREVPSKQVIFM